MPLRHEQLHQILSAPFMPTCFLFANVECCVQCLKPCPAELVKRSLEQWTAFGINEICFILITYHYLHKKHLILYSNPLLSVNPSKCQKVDDSEILNNGLYVIIYFRLLNIHLLCVQSCFMNSDTVSVNGGWQQLIVSEEDLWHWLLSKLRWSLSESSQVKSCWYIVRKWGVFDKIHCTRCFTSNPRREKKKIKE